MTHDNAILTHYLAPLRAQLDAPDVTELVINRPREFAVETRQGWRWFDAPDLTEEAVWRIAVAACAATRQDVGPDRPVCSTVLPTGERCQVVLPPAAEKASITLRKPGPATFTLADLGGQGYFADVEHAVGASRPGDDVLLTARANHDWVAFFTEAVLRRRNILISGPTGSGKTTFAKSLIQLIPEGERLITIEDARELIVPHRNVVHLLYAKDGQGLAQVGAKALLESALRMRPDRILLQELRDGSAFFYLRNVNTGHPGTITTIHANSARLAFEQLTLLVKESEAGRELPRADINALLRTLVDIVVQVKREGGRFRIVEVWHEPHRPGALAA